MSKERELSRREFIQKTSVGTVAAVGLSGLAQERAPLAAQESATAFSRRDFVSALGDTLIPSAAGDPGYRSLEWYGITEEVLKGLASIRDADLKLFDESSQTLFDGKPFRELDAARRADYLRMIIGGEKVQDPSQLKTLREVYRAVRRRVFTVFYQNFPEHRVPRDANGIPLLKPGDRHQDTNPNTESLVTGWDIARFKGPLGWEEEEERRNYFKELNWVEEPEDVREAVADQFGKQEDFTAALRAAGTKGDPSARYDVVIVGAGMAGCILAARIAERGVNPANGERLKVALLEWGPYIKGDPRPGYGHPLRRLLFTNVTHEYQDEGRYEAAGARGRLVGGSSMHYGTTAFHPFPEDFLHWRQETGVDWTEQEFGDVIREVHNMFHFHSPPESDHTAGQRLFAQAARNLGYPITKLMHARKNCINCLGCADFNLCKYDSRMSSLVTYVPIAERNGVEIIPNTKVEKVILEKKGSDFVATGVWAEQDGKKVRFRADKVILSSSVTGTPWILYNSGYGPRDVLGKDLVVENPNVGRHADALVDCPRFPALFPYPIKRADRGRKGVYYFLQGGDPEGYDRLVFRENVSATDYPHRIAFSEFAPEFGWEHKQFMKLRGDQIASNVLFAYLAKNSLEGRIERDGKAVFAVKDPYYARRIAEGVLIIRDIFREMGAIRIGDLDPVLRELESIQSSRQASLPPIFECGSCRAGADQRNSVMNSSFECHDIRNLFLCDLSSSPRATLGDPGTCIVAHLANWGWRRIVKNHFSRASLEGATG